MLYPIQNGVRNKLDISGIWDFKIDPDEVGEKNGWYNGLEDDRPVVLYSVPQTYIEDVTVVTEIDGQNGTVKVTVTLNGDDMVGKVVLAGAGQTVEAQLSFVSSVGEATLTVPSARLWSVEDPYL